MAITVCICTHDRPCYVQDCLNGLRQQTVSPSQFDIVVVDSASTGDVPSQLARMVSDMANARLLRVERPGVSFARNAGAISVGCGYMAYIDDDAVPAPDWIERIAAAISEGERPPALIGGRILPYWEAPLPRWWPARLRGVLSIIEHEGRGEYRTAALPPDLEPYGANMIVHIPSLLAMGGFGPKSGRVGKALLSDEEVQLAWRLQAAGHSVRYDSRIAVRHQIQAERLQPVWLLSRLYWQGVSAVSTRRLLGHPVSVWRELPRRLAVTALLGVSGFVPRRSIHLINWRWRLAYSVGFIRAALRPARR